MVAVTWQSLLMTCAGKWITMGLMPYPRIMGIRGFMPGPDGRRFLLR